MSNFGHLDRRPVHPALNMADSPWLWSHLAEVVKLDVHVLDKLLDITHRLGGTCRGAAHKHAHTYTRVHPRAVCSTHVRGARVQMLPCLCAIFHLPPPTHIHTTNTQLLISRRCPSAVYHAMPSRHAPGPPKPASCARPPSARTVDLPACGVALCCLEHLAAYHAVTPPRAPRQRRLHPAAVGAALDEILDVVSTTQQLCRQRCGCVCVCGFGDTQ